MTADDRIPFDSTDKTILAGLDPDFTISSDNETATVNGLMKVTATRHTVSGDPQLWLRLQFPNGEELDITVRRVQFLDELNLGNNTNA